jgi:ferredoxin
MILYFTGTGNSRHVANEITQATGDDIEDIAIHLRKHEAGSYASDTPYFFVGPVYAGRLPRVMTKFIEDSEFAGTSKAYFVATCAETPWVTFRYVQRLAKEKGFDVLGFSSVLMPQSYITGGLSQPEDACRKIVHGAEPKIAEIAALIRDGKALPEEQPGKAYMSAIVNPIMYATMMGTGKFRATDNCVGCGTCAAKCPLGNIKMVDGKPVWGKDCTQCNACIGACPQGAIEYGSKTVGKPRYYLAK